MVSELWFFDTPMVRFACRLTLPTDESSVKTILLKMRWIVLISCSFIPYLYSTSLLTFTSFGLLLSSSFLVGGFSVVPLVDPSSLMS